MQYSQLKPSLCYNQVCHDCSDMHSQYQNTILLYMVSGGEYPGWWDVSPVGEEVIHINFNDKVSECCMVNSKEIVVGES